MKRTVLILVTFLMLSLTVSIACSIDPLPAQEPDLKVNLQKGKPLTEEAVYHLVDSLIQAALADANLGSTIFTGGTATQDIVIDGNGHNIIFKNFGNLDFDSNSYIHFTKFYYMRRETLPNEWGTVALEEINAEDYKMQVARGGNGSFFWMDNNPKNTNIVLDAIEEGGYSKISMNNLWLQFTQDKGIYHFPQLKEFGDNEIARAYFESQNWRKLNTLYKDPDGLRATE